MKKRLFSLILILMILSVSSSYASSFPMPEKIRKQLSIGSGLRILFNVSCEGEKFETPFLSVINNADFYALGKSVGEDLYGMIYQQDEQDQKSGISELYRRDGTYYFRSDLVPGKIISFPTAAQFLDTVFPVSEDHASVSSFFINLFTLSETENSMLLEPVLSKYQKLMWIEWLSGFISQSDTVKMEDGTLATDLTYVIPLTDMISQVIDLFDRFTNDPEVTALVEQTMTKEQKTLYMNHSLLYYYNDLLSSLDLNGPVRITRRITARDVLSSSLILPLDPRITGFRQLAVEYRPTQTMYTLSGDEQYVFLSLPADGINGSTLKEKAYWFSRVFLNPVNDEEKQNISLRADLSTTSREYDDENDISHLYENHVITIRQDDTYLPPEFNPELLSPFEEMTANIDFHYYSKFSHNSPTTLEFNAVIRQNTSTLTIDGKLRTADSSKWVLTPFEIIDPLYTGTDANDVLAPYMTDWISNALSVIYPKAAETNAPAENPAGNDTEQPETEQQPEDHVDIEDVSEPDAEAVPLDETGADE